MISIRRAALVAAYGVAVLCSAASTWAQDWAFTTVDSTGNVGSYPSLAVLPSGYPAIAYNDTSGESLDYAWFDGTAWQTTVIESGAGPSVSLAMLPSGTPAVAYYSSGELHYATFDGATWQPETVDAGGDGAAAGAFCSLAVLPSGQPAISYVVLSAGGQVQELYYASHESGQWQSVPVDTAGSVGAYSSLKVLPSGQPAIAYFDSSSLEVKYAAFDGQLWQIAIVDGPGTVAGYTSLAIVAGEPAISYGSGSPDTALKYARFDGATWQIAIVDAPGFVSGFAWWTSMAVLTSGEPAISYLAAEGGLSHLRYAWLDDVTWRHTTVDASSQFTYTSLAILPGGQPGIAYYDTLSADLRYAVLVSDCNHNGVPDRYDLEFCAGQPWCADCNDNGVLDVCDISAGTSLDCNLNDIPDECDIATGTSHDCNLDGVPDECDIAAGTSRDCNENGVPDECDIATGTSHDCNLDGVPDECQSDRDHDGTIDLCDGCPDDPLKIAPGACGCGVPDTDRDGDGVPDCIDNCPDTANPDQTDSDDNGVGDACDVAPGSCLTRCLIRFYAGQPLTGHEVADCDCAQELDNFFGAIDQVGANQTGSGGQSGTGQTGGSTGGNNQTGGGGATGLAGVCSTTAGIMLSLTLLGLLRSRPRGALRR